MAAVGQPIMAPGAARAKPVRGEPQGRRTGVSKAEGTGGSPADPSRLTTGRGWASAGP